MPDRAKIRAAIDTLTRTLDRLSSAQNELCENTLTGGVAAGSHPVLAELEEVRAKADDLKRQIAAMKNKGKLDPEVRDLESKLETILARYYWLWQKCKAGMA
jgi:DNA repair exonuclease SbcCD ATPase subunit